MIIKKIANPKKSSTKSDRINGLTDYIANPPAGEKLLHSGALNFFAKSFEGQKVEMLAVAEGAVKSNDPVNHYVLSWKEGEQPSVSQIDEVVNIFIEELGAVGLHVIYGCHQDTQNRHLHLAISRVDPDSGKVRELQKGFDIEAGHRAIARIEDRQGWKRENNGRYRVVNGVLGKCQQADDAAAKPAARVRDREILLGEKSAQTVGIESAAPVIKAAKSWSELHASLDSLGMRYEKKGSGAIIWVGDVAIKASTVDRGASMSTLIKRLGAYESAPSATAPEPLAPAPAKDNQPEWSEYRRERQAHQVARDADKLALSNLVSAQRAALFSRHKSARETLWSSRKWKGQEGGLNAARSLLAAEQAAEKADLKDQHQRSRELGRHEFGTFPSYEDWLRAQGNHSAAEAYRHSRQENLISSDKPSSAPARLVDIRAFRGAARGSEVYYTQEGYRSASFVDRGHHIAILRTSPETVLSALQLGAQKWGSVTITGSDTFKKNAVLLAVKNGIRINNPELQTLIERHKKELYQPKTLGDWNSAAAPGQPTVPPTSEPPTTPTKKTLAQWTSGRAAGTTLKVSARKPKKPKDK